MSSYDYRKTLSQSRYSNGYTVHSGLFDHDRLNGFGMVMDVFDYDVVTDVTGTRYLAHYGFYEEGVLQGFYLHIRKDEEPYDTITRICTCGIGKPGEWELAVEDGLKVVGKYAEERCLPLPDGSELRIEEEDGLIVFCGLYRDGVRNGLGCQWDKTRLSKDGYWCRGNYHYKRERIDGYWENGKLVKIREEDRLVDAHE
ncbi:MAG: hypothetical protein IJ518_06910 [Clostridia bacterium]|nr:hypothetical protein [Clostridia bacterium]